MMHVVALTKETLLEATLAGKLVISLNEACDKFGNAIAMVSGQRKLTYASLSEKARTVSDVLSRKGIALNEPVHVSVSNDPLDLAAFLGVWRAGGVVVPVHRSTPSAVADKIQRKTRARYLVDMSADINELSSPISAISSNQPPDRDLLRDAAFIIFTSGSTGVPKGVVVSHNAFRGKIEQIDTLLNFQSNDRILLVLNITFSFGLWLSLITLLCGATLVMQEKFDRSSFLHALIDERITRVGMVPTMMRVLLSSPDTVPEIDKIVSANNLHNILIGGESLGSSLAASIRQHFHNTRLIDIYGLTETATSDFFAFPEDSNKYPGCIGRPAPNVQFRIVDDAGTEVARHSVGELQIRSPYLMNGYLDAPSLTAAAFSDGWFKTGDLAKEVDNFVVEIKGRSKELISRGGNKVTPGEIEQLMCSHPNVAAAMATGIPDRVLGERIHVLLVPQFGAKLEIQELKEFLQNKLEKFKQPDTYYISEELPLGRTGKADRGQFKSMIEAGLVVPTTLT